MDKRYVENKITLREHLDSLDQNSKAGREEIGSLLKRMKKRFRDIGYVKVSKSDMLVLEYIRMIFETQDYRCTHWLQTTGDQLNGVWNRPGTKYCLWHKKTVHYEIDHVFPVNAGGTDDLKNFQFLSANANQFVKCSLTYQDLLKRIDLSDILKDRIRNVLARRQKLFSSDKWKNYIDKINKYEKASWQRGTLML